MNEPLTTGMFPSYYSFNNRCKRFLARNIPHRTKSKSNWCWPIWYIKIFGGTGDTGNGYCWYPSKFKTYK